YLAEAIELDTGELEPGKPVELRFSAKLTDPSDGTTAQVGLQAQATLDAGMERVTLVKPAIDVDAAGKSIPAQSLQARFGAEELVVVLAEDTALQFRALQGQFSLPGLQAVAADATGSFTAGEARLSFGKSTELVLPTLQAKLSATGKGIPGDTVSVDIRSTAMAADIDKLWANIETLSADVNGLGAKMSLTAKGRVAGSGAQLNGTLRLDPLSPRSLLAALDEPAPETADPAALTRFGGNAEWSLGRDALDLTALEFELDQTRISGSAGLQGFDQPLARFDLALDAIDLDRYLAPEAADGAAGGGSGGDAAPTGDDIPVETLRELRLDGRLAIAQLVYAGAKLADVSATVRADGGRLRIDPLAARAYGGQFRGNIGVDATGPVARVSVEQQLDALAVGPALTELFDVKELTGALSGRIDLAGTGNTTDAIVKTLAGNVALSLADGAWLGTDLWHEIRTARARLKGEAPPPRPAAPQTPLEALELAGNIGEGVLRTEKLLAQVPFIRLSGTGSLALAGQALDYRLQAKVFETPTFEDGSTLKDLTGLTIPLTVKGPLDSPKVGVEIKQLATGIATEKLRERLLKKLGGDEPAPAEGAEAAPAAGEGEQAAPTEAPPKEEKPRDILKRGLRDLLKQP
ncbi:MAG: AsmA family protein, partial [Gammaproteobacteria bacterium]|nr:AsmA family protein [Gammaproteobacteria bacterium]